MEPTTLITLSLTVLSTVGTAIWTIWTWREHHDEELKHEQEKLNHEKDVIAAEYINPFLFSAAVLRTHLYKILHEDGLRSDQSANSESHEIASPSAFETLYLFSAYFFWEYCFLRYGPYVKDSKALTLFTGVSRILSSSLYPGSAFRFSHSEQLSLGLFNVHTLQPDGGMLSPQLEANLANLRNLSLYEFIEKITQEMEKPSPIAQSQAIQTTLKAMEKVERAENLEGYERLLDVEKQLIDVIGYFKAEQNFSSNIQLRQDSSSEIDNVIWMMSATHKPEIVHRVPGRIRLRIPRLHNNEFYAERLQAAIASLPRIGSVKLNLASSSVVITCDPELSMVDVEREVLSAIAALDKPRSA